MKIKVIVGLVNDNGFMIAGYRRGDENPMSRPAMSTAISLNVSSAGNVLRHFVFSLPVASKNREVRISIQFA